MGGGAGREMRGGDAPMRTGGRMREAKTRRRGAMRVALSADGGGASSEATDPAPPVLIGAS